MRSRWFAGVAALAALVLLGAAPSAQTPTQGRPTFRTGIDIVQIDVTVLGPDGKPVHGLVREDFTLLEDGEPQEILGFGEVNVPDATDGPAWLRDASPDVRTTDDGRVLIFLLDDAQTNNDLKTKARLETVKRIAAEVIDRMGPTDVAAVVCTFDTRCAQDFTNDRALLKAAVARFTPKQFNTAGGGGAWSYDWYRQSAGVSGSVVKYLIEQAGRRKALIYVTAREPIRPEVWPPPTCPAPGCMSLEAAVTAQQVIRTFEDAMRARVTVYNINSSGLLPLGEGDAAGLVPPPGPLSDSMPPRYTSAPRSLSEETGGFSIRSPTQFTESVAQIFRETGSYYLLGYEQPPKKDTGYNMLDGLREIEIRVNRPGLTIKTHRGYIVPKPAKPSSSPPPAPASSALAGILPKTDVRLRAAVAPFAVMDPATGKLESTVAIVLGVLEPTPGARTLDRLDLQFRAFTQRGEARGMATQQLDVTIAPGRDDEVLFESLTELRLKPGVYALRMSAASDRLGKEGSVYADVEVPDFAKAPLSLSGVLLASVPGPSASPSNALAAIAPVIPTTLREFTFDHQVTAFMRVYQGGKGAVLPVTVTARVLDASSRVVIERTDTLSADRFGASRSADYRFGVYIDKLDAGLHLLRIEAVAGAATARRDVRFTAK